MQVAIDNAKRSYDINLSDEIRKIKKDMNISENKLPNFWQITKKDKSKTGKTPEKSKKNKEKIRKNLNRDLICPMNYLYSLELNKYRNKESTLPMSYFFVKHEFDMQHRVARRVEELIENYSLDLFNFYMDHDGVNWEEDKDECFLLISNFEDIIRDISQLNLGKKYSGLMSWLINRAFGIGSGTRRNEKNMISKINKNKSILMKTLYEVNRDTFLSCFTEKKCEDLNKLDA